MDPQPSPAPIVRSRILSKWISRFDLWPYLERYTIDATREVGEVVSHVFWGRSMPRWAKQAQRAGRCRACC